MGTSYNEAFLIDSSNAGADQSSSLTGIAIGPEQNTKLFALFAIPVMRNSTDRRVTAVDQKILHYTKFPHSKTLNKR